MNRSRSAASLAVSALVAAAALLPACASQEQALVSQGAQVLSLGEPYRSAKGDVFVLRIQDEYKVRICMEQEGPIQGCFEDVYTIARNDLTDDPNVAAGTKKVRWNQWIDLHQQVPGLHLMFLAPERVAFLQDPVPATPK